MFRNSSFFLLLILSSFYLRALGHWNIIGESRRTERFGGRRTLLGFKETPRGTNSTFECSPSGPCVACLYSEKNDEKYRCSETGYHIPLKCVESEGSSKLVETRPQKSQMSKKITVNHGKLLEELIDTKKLAESSTQRNLLDVSTSSEGGLQAYITYRSCIPAVNEERLSIIGFEGVIFCMLLISGSVIYFRRKRTVTMSGVSAGRTQSNSRF